MAMTLRSDFIARSGHPLDRFQLEALDAIDADESVLVAAPTGSGKTLVAEYAIARALGAGLRAFYTAPIKALSNQKYRDLADRHGADRVGLLTGDNSINPDAPVVVMTTEVLRNMLYLDSRRLGRLGVVVLDEVHFLQDAYRGPVWEEVIIHLEPEINLVCLSATVSNAAEVAAWLTTVRGSTRAVVEERRPVEIRHHYLLGDGATGQVSMHELLVNGVPNDALRQKLARDTAQRSQTRDRRRRGRSRYFPPSRPDIVEILERQGMLPAIVFIFSRAQCEDAVKTCRRAGIVLTDEDERRRIAEVLAHRVTSLSDDDRRALDFERFREDCLDGFTCHHAGMVPMFREAVEECFALGLVKVVFATETLAVGINMPAKAVVIEKMTKFTGEHHTLLKASEFTQLTGRAGRRGLDVIGHALAVWNPYTSFDQLASLASSRSFELRSAFRPTFNMAVNLIRSHSRVETHHLLNLSFAQYQADNEVTGVEARLQRLRKELAGHPSTGGPPGKTMAEHPVSAEDSMQRDTLDATHDDTHDDAQDDTAQAVASSTELEIALRSLRPGDVFMAEAASVRGRVLVVATANRRAGTRLTLLTPSRKMLTVVASDFERVPVRGASVELPVPHEPARTEFVREAARRLVNARIDGTLGPAVAGAAGRAVRRRRPDDVGSSRRDSRRIQREIDQLSARQAARTGAIVARFEDVVRVLTTLGYVDDWSLTTKGEVLSHIFHESDILISELVLGTHLSGLSAPDLAAVLSSVTFERRSADESPVRWPSDVVRDRVRRLTKTSQRLIDVQRQAGMAPLREPDASLAWETHQWVAGKPLSSIVDADVSAGDFVRQMRQLIDLCRQIGDVTPDEGLRAMCEEARRRLDRGVVSASVGGGVFDGN